MTTPSEAGNELVGLTSSSSSIVSRLATVNDEGGHERTSSQVMFHTSSDFLVSTQTSLVNLTSTSSPTPALEATDNRARVSVTATSEDKTSSVRPFEEDRDYKEDMRVLEKMGYKQELYRGFNAFMNFSFCMTSVAVVSSITLGFSSALNTGGPGIYSVGWLVASFFTILIGLNLAEICSTYPSAGSVYHWSGMLASERWSPFFSYVSGWFNFMGNAAGDASYAYGFAYVVSNAIDLADYDAYQSRWNTWYSGLASQYTNASTVDCTDQTTIDVLTAGPPQQQLQRHMGYGAQVALGIGVAALWALKNIMRIDKQGWLNNFSSIWQMMTTCLIVIVLLSKASTLNSGSWIFGDFVDNTGFDPAQGGPSGFNHFAYLCFIGLLNALFAQSGYEAAGHVAEETRGATKAAPWGIVGTVFATCGCGFIYIIAILATTPNAAGTISFSDPICQLGGGSYSFVVFATFYSVLGFNGAMWLSMMVIVDMFFAGFSSLTVTTRIGFAMARDNAFPGSSVLKYVWPVTATPVFNILLVFFLDACLVLLVLVTMNDPLATFPVAFSAVTAITVVGYQISYAIPILQRSLLGNRFRKSAFHLGPFGGPLGFLTSLWLICTSCIMVFPTTYIPPGSSGDVYRLNLNYTPVVVVGTMLIAFVFWMLSARYHFVGPKRGEGDNCNDAPAPAQEGQTI